MRFSRIGLYLMGLSYAFFLLDFPVFGFFTTSRLGFLMLLFGFSLYYTSMKSVFRISKEMRVLNWGLFVTFFGVFLSTLYHMSPMKTLYSVGLIAVLIFILGAVIKKRENYDMVLKGAVTSSFILIVLFLIYSITNFGFYAFQTNILRYRINEFAPGLNRIVNGITFANIIILVYYFLNRSKKNFNLVIFVFCSSFWFVLSSHSRQGLLLLIIIFIAFTVFSYSQFKYKKLAALLGIIGLILLLNSLFYSSLFLDHFLHRTTEQLDSGEGSTAIRLSLYQAGIKYLETNFFLGIGPENFQKYEGLDAHSGYLRIVAENGIFALLGILIIFTHFFYNGVKYIKRKQSSFALILLAVVLAPFFNSIYDKPMYWMTFAIIVCGFNNFIFRKKFEKHEYSTHL